VSRLETYCIGVYPGLSCKEILHWQATSYIEDKNMHVDDTLQNAYLLSLLGGIIIWTVVGALGTALIFRVKNRSVQTGALIGAGVGFIGALFSLALVFVSALWLGLFLLPVLRGLSKLQQT
jgi:hypothetical protein